MLKPVEMRELRIVTLEEDVDRVIKRIESTGSMHIADIREVLDRWGDLIEPSKADDILMKTSSLLSRMDNVIALLQPPEVKKGIKEALFKKAEEIEKVRVEERSVEEIERDFEVIESEVIKLSEERDRLKFELGEAEEVYRVLGALRDLGVEIDFVGEREFIVTYVGKLPVGNIEELRRLLEQVVGEKFYLASKEIEGVGEGEEKKESAISVVIILKENKAEVERILRMVDFETWTPPSGLSPKTEEAIKEIEAKKEGLREDIKRKEEKLEGIREERLRDLLVMRELVQIEESKGKVKTLLGRSGRARVIEGWVPKEEVDKVVGEIKQEVGEFCIIEVEKPRREDVRVPSLIRNPPIIRSFESIVKMYSPPSYKDIDPTIITAIIFPVLFGLMFPDIGHGFILFLLGLLLIFAFKGLGRGMKDMGIIITLCGFCSMIGGALFGEFFGFSEYLFHHLLEIETPEWFIFKPLWIEPILEPKYLFAIVMIIGMLHMGLGLFLNGINNLSNKNILESIDNFVGIWCLFGALYFLLLLFGKTSLIGLGGVELKKGLIYLIVLPIFLLFIIGVVKELKHGGEGEAHHSGEEKEKRSIMDYLIILISGVIDAVLEKFFRYLANTVSYGRILALALCHAALIEVFILLSFMTLKINVIIGALLFIGGTAIVIILEALIASIHTIRLHFYEWFTKFYEGGGVEFTPFKFSRRYTYT
ncbi:MAG: V-type ATP synthase subunit I [Candidatus Methanospirareceae archaeon]